MKLGLNDEEIIVRAGEVLCIPPNVPHEAVALEDTVDLDIFTPPREDWIGKTDAYLRRRQPCRAVDSETVIVADIAQERLTEGAKRNVQSLPGKEFGHSTVR